MADPTATDARIEKSHLQRARFENWLDASAAGILVVSAALLLVGIGMRPALPCHAPCVQGPDWGASIVARFKDAVPVFWAIYGAIGGFLSISLTRGAHDARIGGE